MEAKILPLKGKYYGTEIEVRHENGAHDVIELWHTEGPPSERELEDEPITVKEWEENKIVWGSDGWQAGWLPAKEVYEICDGHYESQKTYEMACDLVNAINNYKGV